MMPLVFQASGSEVTIKKIGGTSDIKKHLETLGFVVGSELKIITSNNGNLIVEVKGSKVAINDEIAKKIMV